MKRFSLLADVVTVIFLFLTVVVVAITLLLVANPHSALNPFPQPTLIPVLVQPTDLPTYTPSFTPTDGPPTATRTVTGTATASATRTSTKTATASPTRVLALQVTTPPAKTAAQPSPPPFTQSPFPYTVGPIKYQPNQTAEGCKWNSIAGTVTGLNGAPQKGVAVSVVGGGGTIDEARYSGQDLRFGESGFEVFLGSQPREDDYTVTLLSKTGAPLSDAIKVRTKNGCTQNILIINFYQNH